MKILVLIKYVPDATADRRFTEDLTTERDAVPGVLSELDEYAVEQALRQVEAGVGMHVTYLTMGPPEAGAALRKALSMGGDAAVHVCDDELRGSDYLVTSRVLARAAEKIGFDLLVCGMASTDGGGQVLPTMVAERLGIPQLSFVTEFTLGTADESTVSARREGDGVIERLEAAVPAVVSVTDQSGEPRYPSFKGIMAAKKKPVTTWSLADLDLDPAVVGRSGSVTSVQQITRRPARQAGRLVPDEGDGGRQLAGFLASEKLI